MSDAEKITKPKNEPSLDEAIFWIIFIVVFAIVIQQFDFFEYFNILQLSIAALALIIFKLRGKKLANLGFRISKKAVKTTGIFILCLGLFYGLILAFLLIFTEDEISSVSTDFDTVLRMVLVAPIFEEIFFRGFLYNALRKNFGLVFSLVFSALIFMVMHQVWGIVGPENINHFFGGLVFAFAYEKTKSIYAPMFLHCLGNASILILTVLPIG